MYSNHNKHNTVKFLIGITRWVLFAAYQSAGEVGYHVSGIRPRAKKEQWLSEID